MRPALRPGPRRSVFGLLMAVLALLGQVVAGSALPGLATPAVLALTASPFGDIPICYSGGHAPADDGEPAGDGHHHGTQCALCPACHVLAAAVLPVPTSAVPAPRAMPAGRPLPLPPPRGPPATAVLAATYPTGPPRLA